MFIGKTAISLDYTVVTGNLRDFGKIEGLRVERR